MQKYIDEEDLIPAGNEPSGCASIHLANAARVTYQSVRRTLSALQRYKLDAPLLSAEGFPKYEKFADIYAVKEFIEQAFIKNYM